MTLPTNQTGQQDLMASFSSGRSMGARLQSISEVITYSVDYSNWLAPGEILSTITYSISSTAATPVVISGSGISASFNSVSFQVSGGLANYKYEIDLTAATSTGQVKIDKFYITVLPATAATSGTGITLPPSNVFMSQFKRALSMGYASVGIPASSVLTVQLAISSNPSDPDALQWYSGLYISSGDPVWLVVKAQFGLTDAQTDQFLTFASNLAP